MVTVSVDDYRFTTEDLVKRVGLTAPVLLDPGGKTMLAWGTVKYPETWILDREGRVADRVTGARDWASEETKALLREPARWPTLKAAARRYVETEHNWKSSVARYADVYTRLTQPHRHA